MEAYPAWYASDNGFSTVSAMDDAHGPIVSLAAQLLAESGGNVLDLGCGNGALLLKILRKRPGVAPFGVEMAPERAGHVAELLPGFTGNFRVADMFDNPGELWGDTVFSLAIVMPGRFLEIPREQTESLRTFLESNCRRLLLYAYGDWLERFGSLSRLAERAGFSMPSAGPRSRAGLGTVAGRR